MMYRYGIVALTSVLLLAACTRKYPFPKRPEMDRVAVPAFQGRAVAVQLSEPAVMREYSGSASGNKFKVTEIHEFMRFFFGQLGEGAKSLQFVDSGQAAGADLILYPDLKINWDSSVVIHHCAATFSITAKDSSGTVVGQASGEDSYDFSLMANGGRACEIATLQVIGPVMDQLSAAILGHGPLASAPAGGAPGATAGAGCRVDTDCAGDDVCEQGRCASTAPAAASAPGCVKDTDCKGDRICQDGKCIGAASAPPPPPPPAAAGCLKDTDCKGDRICQDGRCIAEGSGPPPPAAPANGCTTNAQCKGGRVCQRGQCASPR